jgi:hypothetical protein
MKNLSIFLLLTIASLPAWATAEPPPRNPFLADSTWPMTHGGPYNQDSSAAPGPSRDDLATYSIATAPTEPVPITLAISGAYPDGSRVAWGNTKSRVFKLMMTADGTRLSQSEPRAIQASTEITGAYALVTHDFQYVVPRDLAMDVFTDAVPGDPMSRVVVRSHDFAPQLRAPRPGERLVGFSMTYDGFFAFATNTGRTGIVTRDGRVIADVQLFPGTLDVSNTIAVDEAGGVYVLTDKNLQKLRWNGATLTHVWSVAYRSDDFHAPGRLGKGSGTSPTLMGAGADADRLVVFSDGRQRMRLLALWRDEIPSDWVGLPGMDRRVAGELPVTFGKNSPDRAITEQSVVVSGYGAALVDNSYGDIGRLATAIARRRGHDVHKATIFLSNSRGVAPYGVERIDWDPMTRSLRSRWARPDISCPNGIPAVSESSNLFYCIGQRQTRWNVEALDWTTGDSAYHLPLGKQDAWNSFYAGIEIGPWRSLLTGTFGGGVVIHPQP